MRSGRFKQRKASFFAVSTVVTAVAILVGSISAYAGDAEVCKNLFASDHSFLKAPIAAFRENWPGFISRFRPVYRDSRFEVRIASMGMSRNSFSPAKLRDEAVVRFNEALTSLEALGFKQQGFLDILIESHEGALGFKEEGSTGWLTATQMDVGMSVIGDEPQLGFPYLFGSRRFGYLDGERKGYPGQARFVLIPVESNVHELEIRSAVIHEIAHVTEPDDSHTSEIWAEARADFLTYLVTGQTEVDLGEESELTKYDLDGRIVFANSSVDRDFGRAATKTVSEMVPRLQAKHQNSTLYSSLLLEIEKTMGREKAISFILWMDHCRSDQKLPRLVSIRDGHDPDPKILIVHTFDFEQTRAVLHDQARKFGALVREWARGEKLSHVQNLWLEHALSYREL